MKLITYEQPTSAPVPKVTAVGVTGLIVSAIVSILALTGVIVPEGVSDAAVQAVAGIVTVVSLVQTIVTFITGYLKKDVKSEQAVKIIKNQS
jgi:hypothetical protein